MEKIVILGAGPAGCAAAVYTARADLSPLVLEGSQPGGQLTTTGDVENFPGFPEPIAGADLVERMKAQAERFGARFVRKEAVSVAFNSQPLRLIVDDGASIEANTVVIATGASAIYLGLDSEQQLIGRGVSGCATCDGAFYRNLPVAVVGGGDTAMEEALFLTRFASSVTVIHRRDAFRASRIMADRVLSHPKIVVRWNAVVVEALDPARGEVTGLRLRDVLTGQEDVLEVAGVFIAIGHRPNTSIFKGQVELDEKGYVVAKNTRTNVPGVFAAGDVQDHVYRQAITAAGSGCMAAIEVERYLKETQDA